MIEFGDPKLRFRYCTAAVVLCVCVAALGRSWSSSQSFAWYGLARWSCGTCTILMSGHGTPRWTGRLRGPTTVKLPVGRGRLCTTCKTGRGFCQWWKPDQVCRRGLMREIGAKGTLHVCEVCWARRAREFPPFEWGCPGTLS